MSATQHWETIYTSKTSEEVSWYQPRPEQSLRMIAAANLERSAPIIDVGAGTSTLVDDLLADLYTDITVLDVSATALQSAQTRLGAHAKQVTWIVADVTTATLPPNSYALWHDRAVFHFLRHADDRRRYVDILHQSTRPDAQLIIATFAHDGPTHCSGLEVVRYTPESLAIELGSPWTLIETVPEAHHTPWHSVQQFVYCRFKRN
ncbi:MAG: class I SAM-dependent methyltransferase [Herpetosiphon sp.]